MLRHGVGDAASFVAEHKDASGADALGRIDVLSAKECAIDSDATWHSGEHGRQIAVEHFHPGHGPHGGLYGLSAEYIGRIGRCQHGVHPHPVGRAHDGAEIAGVLHAVESHHECVRRYLRLGLLRNLVHGNDRRRCGQSRHARHVGTPRHHALSEGSLARMFVEPCRRGGKMPQPESSESVEHAFRAFGGEKSDLAAAACRCERGYCLAQRC